jgi:type IV pilus assembly protein PilQ
MKMKLNTHAHLALATALALATTPVVAAVPAPATTHEAATPRAATTSFHFSNIPVRSALQLLAEEGDFNLVVSDSVKGNITLHLEDVTWEQALEVVLRLKGLEMRVEGASRSVAPSR